MKHNQIIVLLEELVSVCKGEIDTNEIIKTYLKIKELK